MHIHHLPIPLFPIHNRRDNNQLIPQDEVPYTPFVLAAVARDSWEFESQCRGELRDEHQGEERA